jgi:anhydro-N-acetylmuramic acid kinase
MWEKDSDYLQMPPPKSTGRESYNADYIRLLLEKAGTMGLSPEDTLASVTCYTADTIRIALKHFCPELPRRLIIGGGGAHNETLLGNIRRLIPGCAVVSADEMGINADAKEAVAFAVLANETLHGICNNAPSATGAGHPVIMGKISF